MEEPEKVVFTIPDMLKWAWDETELANALEASGEVLRLAPPGPALAEEIALCRRRSRWLDQQVELVFKQADAAQRKKGTQ